MYEASFLLLSVLILALSTATAQTEITLIHGRKTVFQKKWPSNYDEAEKLIPAIESALSKAKSKPEGILVVNGPGNFTGLRIGVTIANTLVFTYDIPIFSISTFQFLQKKIPESLERTTAILLKAGGGFVALKKLNDKQARLFHREKLPQILSKGKINFLVTDMKAQEKKKYVLPKNTHWLPEKKLKAFSQVVREYMKEKPQAHKMIKPLYLKPPTITISKKPIFA